MKKLMIVFTVMALFVNSLSFATMEEIAENGQEEYTQQEVYHGESTDTKKSQDTTTSNESATSEGKTSNGISLTTPIESNVTSAAKKILENSTKKDEKIAKYMEKYNDTVIANIAYWLDVVRLYSIPICIVGIAIGAFNFYIIGEKKLEKREKGFSSVMGFLCGLVFFQVLPLLFALVVVGR